MTGWWTGMEGLRRRGILGDDDYIPVDELPEDEDMASWERAELLQGSDDSSRRDSEDKLDD